MLASSRVRAAHVPSVIPSGSVHSLQNLDEENHNGAYLLNDKLYLTSVASPQFPMLGTLGELQLAQGIALYPMDAVKIKLSYYKAEASIPQQVISQILMRNFSRTLKNLQVSYVTDHITDVNLILCIVSTY